MKRIARIAAVILTVSIVYPLSGQDYSDKTTPAPVTEKILLDEEVRDLPKKDKKSESGPRQKEEPSKKKKRYTGKGDKETDKKKQRAERKKQRTKKRSGETAWDRDFNMYASLFGAFGLSLPLGKIAGDGEQKGKPGKGFLLGGLYGYRFLPHHSAYVSVYYSQKEIVTEYSYMGQDARAVLNASFLDFALAYRGAYSIFYFEGGVYFGLVMPAWSRKEALNGSVSETLMYGSLKSRSSWEIGLLVGGGVQFPLSKSMDLQAGVEIHAPFKRVYEDPAGNELMAMAFMVKMGVVYKW